MALCVYTTISFVYMISHIRTDFLTLTYGLLNPSDLPYDVTPYRSNNVYLTLYGILWPCTTECHILFHSTIFLYLLDSVCLSYNYSVDV